MIVINKEMQTGHPENLTAQQREVLLQFRQYVTETYTSLRKQLWDDWFLLRFCRAREFKLKDVKKMFDNYIEYYKTNHIGEIIKYWKQNTQEAHQVFNKHTFRNIYGYNKEGMPVELENRKYYDDYGLVKNMTKEKYVEVFAKLCEDMQNIIFPLASKRAGKRIDRFCLIFDLKDASITQFFNGTVSLFSI